MASLQYWRFKNWPIIVKLSVVFSALMSVVIAAVVVNLLTVYNHSFENQMKQLVARGLTHVGNQVDLYVDDIIHESQSLLSHSPYEQLLKLASSSEYKETGRMDLKSTLELHRLLGGIGSGFNQQMVNLVFYTPYGTAYVKTEEGGLWQDVAYESKQWANLLDLRTFAPVIAGFIKESFYGMNTDVFSVIQPIRSKNGRDLVGLLQLNGSLPSFQGILDRLNLEEGSVTYIIDRDKRVLYSTQGGAGLNLEQWIGVQLKGATSHNAFENSELIIHEDQPYLLSQTALSPAIGWEVVSMTPLQHLNKGMVHVQTMTWIWLISGIVLAILLSTIVAYGIAKPIRMLAVSIKKFESGQNVIEPPPVRFDELGRLALTFSRMTQRIRMLMKDNVKKESLRQEAEIQALYHQMNPHFLYNALESLRMTLMLGNKDKAELGLVALGRLLRYKTSYKSNYISIKQEMELTQYLLHIQKLRFADRLQVDIQIDEEAYDVLIPSFIIQPLVENAIKYGESPYDQIIRIQIKITLNGDFIEGQVDDEGNGLSPEELENVIEMMRKSSNQPNRHGIGLYNIYQRIQLLYGGRGEMMMDSLEGSGTTVSFRLPILRVLNGSDAA